MIHFVAYSSRMHRSWILVVALACGSTQRPPTPAPEHAVQASASSPTTSTAPHAAPALAKPAEAPPKSACEIDAASVECKCNSGDTDACLRIAETERRHGNHDVAIASVLGMCQSGVPLACFVGAKYMKQLHVDSRLGTTPAQLTARGQSLYDEKCAANEHALCVEYARLLLQGRYVATNLARGRELVEHECAADQPRACLLLGNMYVSGQGVKRDPKKGLALLEQACTKGGGAACTALADQIAKRAPARAHELYAKACAADDAEACARAGDVVRACELDDVKSCVAAGMKLTDPAAARSAFEDACDADIGEGCAALAPMVATGKGGPRHFGNGIALAEKACKLKAPKACALVDSLRNAPPQVSCSTVDACGPLCEEGIPSACLASAKLSLAADPEGGCFLATPDFNRACELGDAASCMTAGNLAAPREAAGFYAIACKAKVAHACVLRDRAAAFEATGADRTKLVASLAKACRAKDHVACTWYADVIHSKDGLDKGKDAEAERLWSAACDARQAVACRLLAAHIDTNPRWGIGDGSPQRFDEALAKRVHSIYEHGCAYGDSFSCARVKSDLGQEPHTVPERCGDEIRWR